MPNYFLDIPVVVEEPKWAILRSAMTLTEIKTLAGIVALEALEKRVVEIKNAKPVDESETKELFI